MEIVKEYDYKIIPNSQEYLEQKKADLEGQWNNEQWAKQNNIREMFPLGLLGTAVCGTLTLCALAGIASTPEVGITTQLVSTVATLGVGGSLTYLTNFPFKKYLKASRKQEEIEMQISEIDSQIQKANSDVEIVNYVEVGNEENVNDLEKQTNGVFPRRL